MRINVHTKGIHVGDYWYPEGSKKYESAKFYRKLGIGDELIIKFLQTGKKRKKK